MAKRSLSSEPLSRVAERFEMLAEPVRPRIMNALRDGEKTVTKLMEVAGFKRANVSKHLLSNTGFADRRNVGFDVSSRIADEHLVVLCDTMRSRLRLEARRRRSVLEAG